MHWQSRYDPSEARIAIDSDGEDVTLLLTPEVVGIQCADGLLRRYQHEAARKKNEPENSVLAAGLKTLLLDTIGTMLKSSLVCPLHSVRDVEYRDGKLRMYSGNGREIFQGVQVDGEDLSTAFSPRDAQRFVREFHRLKNRQV